MSHDHWHGGPSRSVGALRKELGLGLRKARIEEQTVHNEAIARLNSGRLNLCRG